MNTTQQTTRNTILTTAIAALPFLGATGAGATDVPAWAEEGFVMEEVVVTAEAPDHLFMEEIVVTARAPAHLYMEEIVVTAERPESPLIEEVVVTASLEDVRNERLARLESLRFALLDRT